MVWSHIHPALIHFTVGVGLLALLWDMKRLVESSTHRASPLPVESFFGEILVALFLVGVASGWVALTGDSIHQNGGATISLGSLHGGMGLLLLAGATGRVLTNDSPERIRTRKILLGLDLGLFILLLGTAFLGERLVFLQGLGVSGVRL
ncbi:MAG: hypothetical protein ACP5OS_05335 [Leptospirillia bacterium]